MLNTYKPQPPEKKSKVPKKWTQYMNKGNTFQHGFWEHV